MPSDFLDLGSRAAVDAALSRLARAGRIRRIGRGLYDWPRVHPRFGAVPPGVDLVAMAVARSHGEDICHGEAESAQRLGLTTQVPAQAEYLTDGTGRVVHVDLGAGGGFDLTFRRSTRRAGGNKVAGLVLRALRFLGPHGVDDRVVERFRAVLDARELRRLARLRSQAQAWMQPTIDRVLEAGECARSGGQSPGAERSNRGG